METEITMEEEELLNKEAIAQAEKGIFNHTFFEMWEFALESIIEGAKRPLTMETAASILGAYSWLNHSHLEKYRLTRLSYMERALELLNETLGKNKAKVYKTASTDWESNKTLYLDLVAKWNQFVVAIGDEWAAAGDLDPAVHAALADVAGTLLNNEFGMISNIKKLKGFEITEDDRELLNKIASQGNE